MLRSILWPFYRNRKKDYLIAVQQWSFFANNLAAASLFFLQIRYGREAIIHLPSVMIGEHSSISELVWFYSLLISVVIGLCFSLVLRKEIVGKNNILLKYRLKAAMLQLVDLFSATVFVMFISVFIIVLTLLFRETIIPQILLSYIFVCFGSVAAPYILIKLGNIFTIFSEIERKEKFY